MISELRNTLEGILKEKKAMEIKFAEMKTEVTQLKTQISDKTIRNLTRDTGTGTQTETHDMGTVTSRQHESNEGGASSLGQSNH